VQVQVSVVFFKEGIYCPAGRETHNTPDLSPGKISSVW